MPHVEPLYSKAQVDRAAVTYLDPGCSDSDREIARAIVNNWRSAHSFPLNTFQMTLRRNAREVDADADVVQRIKRLPSIVTKLRRMPGRLSAIQDIGGCRAVVKDVAAVDELVAKYSGMRQAHTLKKMNDYLREPKDDGYRSVHLVYRYRSRRGATAWNSLLIELQLRSRMQHAWATAVETVDTFTAQSMKTGGGRPEWRRFFALMSSDLALRENLPPVPGTPVTLETLRPELVVLATKLDVVARLDAYGATMNAVETFESLTGGHWYLLERRSHDEDDVTLTVRGYPKRDYAQAALEYEAAERVAADIPGRDVVLVSADSIASLKRGYPNYYADATEFARAVERSIRG